jgi:DNA-3-methyladenine glycosylase II
MLGLRVDLTEFYRFAATQRQLRLLAQPFRGMKPPRYETIFESVITAIASQLVTRTVSILVLNRLAERYGVPISSGDLPARAFPVPHDLAGLSPSDLRRLGFSRQKGRAIIELARAVSTGELELERLAELPDAEAIKQLLNLRGIGRWSAGYVLLRGLGRIEVFPGDDVGARNNLQRWLHLVEPPDYAAVRRVLKRWYPYGGLIYFHMLLNRLSEAGHFK